MRAWPDAQSRFVIVGKAAFSPEKAAALLLPVTVSHCGLSKFERQYPSKDENQYRDYQQ
jgi:hypothetical protein